ncbi:hypothetical protein [Sphaerothrix gracilis]|uniref:hypothetical protein n=1 Tax=Sphaerothrix gracilis TaxID=3151835 RepID=UPI0031FD891F
MRRLLSGALVGIGLLSISGCGFVNNLLGRNPEPAEEELTSLDGVPIQTAEDSAENEEFAEPIVPAGPSAAAIASAELIQSTDPEERANQILKNRNDPFATVPIPPPPQVIPPPQQTPTSAPNNTGGRTRPPSPGGLPPTAQRPSGPSGSRQGAGGSGTNVSSNNNAGRGTAGGGTSTAAAGSQQPTPKPSPIEPLPELPTPELATEVQITGVVQIGNKAHAIVKAPGEATSRYVSAGQRLSNGRVLVKRIEVREGIEPRVILEENGIEVAVTVGNSTGGDSSEQASLPAPSTLPL